ncbi:alkaline phosphatase, partial [Photobacterium sp. OFAV2-7]|uniref:alkaline phosphatase n=1 Tax=Photobacterium sp. OFAV2-7 TaxID=2917748 RepID=UPI001EF67DB5
MKRVALALSLLLGMAGVAQAAPKNIIMVVGDGMGPAYTSAYRYFKDNPETVEIEKTVFDRHLIGRASTYPSYVQGLVTDSAASGTALATGYKTYNGAIGLDKDKRAVETVLEYAKSRGKSTGLVVTSQINHATPASYVAHVEKRKMYNQIAD